MRYSIEPRDRVYVKGCRSCLLLEATGGLVGNKIADKITSISKKSTKNLPTIDEDAELTTPKKRYISPEERQQIIDKLRLVPRNY